MFWKKHCLVVQRSVHSCYLWKITWNISWKSDGILKYSQNNTNILLWRMSKMKVTIWLLRVVRVKQYTFKRMLFHLVLDSILLYLSLFLLLFFLMTWNCSFVSNGPSVCYPNRFLSAVNYVDGLSQLFDWLEFEYFANELYCRLKDFFNVVLEIKLLLVWFLCKFVTIVISYFLILVHLTFRLSQMKA